MRQALVAAVILTAACGRKGPPPSFAPDPGLVEQIREIRMSTSMRACPGEGFGAVLYRRPERRVARSVRDAIRQGQSAAPPRRVSGPLEP